MAVAMRLACLMRTVAMVMPFMMMGACAPRKVTTTALPALDQYHVRSVVVMPFDRLPTPQILDTADPEFSVPRGAEASRIYIPPARLQAEHPDRQTTTVPASVPEKVSQMVYRNLKKRHDLHVIVTDELPTAMTNSGRGIPALSPDQQAKDVIRKTGADAALLGRVLVYRERDGSKWGANPAIVGFEVKLIGSDGVTLWTANYYEKQRPLIEDLTGFWQHGGGFVTAEELAEYGAERIARAFPFGTS
jgi:hypothetical protein